MGCCAATPTMARELSIEWRGEVPYAEALEAQMNCVEAVRRGSAPDTLLLLEHPAVITLGRRADQENLLLSREAFAERGIEIHTITRGGDVTFHAPGQLVGYPIVDLEARGEADIGAWLRTLESVLIEAMAALGVAAMVRPGMTGVFIDTPANGRPRKIASIGVGIRGWVTYHGFALNVNPDLGGFDDIVACGLRGVEMTSLARELGEGAPADLFERARHEVASACVRRWS
jgi:lipoyl(octanoyl) transferase